MKIIINRHQGFFEVEETIAKELIEKGYTELKNELGYYEITKCNRDNPILIEIFEKYYGDKYTVEVPDGVKWYIDTLDDGKEIVREHHRIWT